MKKLLSVILVPLFCFSMFSLGAFAEGKEAEQYPVESKFSKKGSHDVSTVIIDSGEKDFKHYKIWYPSELETSTDTYPVIVYCNGTGCTYDTVKETMDHFASWGFVVVSNDHKNSGNGDSASKGLDLILKLNKDSNSIFYNKINIEAIGINGHSQGGSATINATSNGKYENSGMFKSLCAVSAPHSELAASAWQKTPYDVSKVEIPSFLIGGTGAVDAGTTTSSGICPLGIGLITNMKAINNETVIIGRIKDSDHGNTLVLSTAYITAWFYWTLLGDRFAETAFIGDNAEIFTNEKWKDVYNKQSDNLPENPDPYDPEAQSETFFEKLIELISNLVSAVKNVILKVITTIKSFFCKLFD